MPIQILETGPIYANPKPHLRSRQAVFPTVVSLGGPALLASFTVGEAFESVDMHTELARSTDGGRTWSDPVRFPQSRAPFPASGSGRLTRTPAGELLCYSPRFDRTDPDRSIGSAETGGLIECDVVLYRSADEGATWSEAEVVPIPLPGPFEIATPIAVLADGRWLALFSTWRAWDGARRTPERTYALASSDGGRTWPDLLTLFADPEDQITYWETRLIEIGDGRLLAIAWAHDHAHGRDLPNQFAVSADGRTFGPARSTGLPGQTCAAAWLGDGRLLCVYNHRHGDPGVRAALVQFDAAGDWPVEDLTVLWGQPLGVARAADSVVGSMNHFRFGYPRLLDLGAGEFLVTFWCMEEAQLICRWTRIRVA